VLQVAVIRGGIAEFNGVNYAADVSWPEVAGGEPIKVLYNDAIAQGICVEMGPDAAIEPVKIFNAIEGTASDVFGSPQALGEDDTQTDESGDNTQTDEGSQENRWTYAPAPTPRARALGGPAAAVAAKIGEVLIDKITSYDGTITWQLDQMRGIKWPNDMKPDSSAPFTDAKSIRLDDWPFTTAPDGDDQSAWFSIDWQYNGTALGNIAITNVGTNGALLRKLYVEAKIMDDNKLYTNNCAALRIRFNYRFSWMMGSDIIAIRNIHLYGDGTWESDGKWEQQ
jgi:hypothetical protein